MTENQNLTLKSELSLIKGLNKLFKEVLPEDRILISEMEDNNGYITDDDVIMFIPKTEQIKQIFNRFTNKQFSQKQQIPKLDYTHKVDEFFKDRENMSRYSTNRLIHVLNCFNSVFETVDISLLNTYPVKLECEYFIFILAPRTIN
jgi:hypothetical protein